jgi:hypothetical protein
VGRCRGPAREPALASCSSRSLRDRFASRLLPRAFESLEHSSRLARCRARLVPGVAELIEDLELPSAGTLGGSRIAGEHIQLAYAGTLNEVPWFLEPDVPEGW